jgi:phosphatidate phosphatase APP1
MRTLGAGIILSAVLLSLAISAIESRADELKQDERVMLYPAMGWRANGQWEIDLHGWVFEPERRRLTEAVVRRSLGMDDDEMSQAEQRIFHERIQPFLADSEGGKRVRVRIGDGPESVAEADRGGRCRWRFSVSDDQVARWQSAGVFTNGVARFHLVRRDRQEAVPTLLELLEPTGVSVISDIDDTIKVSAISNRRELLRNTFCRPMAPVPGMAELYREWGRTRARVHYVSASPWQLFEPLSAFTRSNGFPPGTFHLKQVGVTDGSLRRLFDSPEEYKVPVIEELLARFPRRQFILVGDSGEKDPEIYGELARKHPEQVATILIRRTDGAPMTEARQRSAFAGVARERWQVFDAVTELNRNLPQDLMKR